MTYALNTTQFWMHEEISHIFYTQTAVKIWKSESDSWLLHSYKTEDYIMQTV